MYLCQKLSLVNEMYFAITLDRKTAGPVSLGTYYLTFLLLFTFFLSKSDLFYVMRMNCFVFSLPGCSESVILKSY